ncbi:MAG TPA: HPF/RaiA family ribosome-associated protein [Bdellovibrio sp.]|nr:HPF/RaiA family ribosome-associated protein [Bdellovibrio sp.]
MQTDIHYRDITRTENLEGFLMERLEAACGDFFKYDGDAHLTVRVETDRHRSHARKPNYICEVILKPTKSRQVIKIKKSHESFKKAVAMTVASLKTVLRRKSSRKNQHHRNDPLLNFIPEWGEEQLLLSIL